MSDDKDNDNIVPFPLPAGDPETLAKSTDQLCIDVILILAELRRRANNDLST